MPIAPPSLVVTLLTNSTSINFCFPPYTYNAPPRPSPKAVVLTLYAAVAEALVRAPAQLS